MLGLSSASNTEVCEMDADGQTYVLNVSSFE
jgi:hypothetical protein